MTDSPRIGAVRARRNGKSASCEQCRKRKLACDHQTPTCGRCARRGIGSNCYYHPAPLTKPAGAKSPPLHGTGLLSPVLTSRSPSTLDTFGGIHASGSLSAKSPAEPFARKPSTVSSARSTGFLGASSSTAVVAELSGSLGIPTPVEIPTHHRNDPVSDVDIENGAKILARLQELLEVEDVHDGFRQFIYGQDGALVFWPIWRIWIREVCSMLRPPLSETSLRTLSAQIWHNTHEAFPHTHVVNAEQWALQATGQNLRWEVVGLILVKIGTNFSNLPGWWAAYRNEPQKLQDRIHIMRDMLNLTTACIAFSKHCGSRNDILTCQMYSTMLLTERVYGDCSNDSWHMMGLVCDMAIMMGFHQQKKVDSNTPFFLCELRIRVFNRIYNHDKFLAEFLGRPPRLSYRHCAFQPISGITDEEICGDERDIPAAIARMKHDDLNSPPSRNSWRKRFETQSFFREDILEIALSPGGDNLDARVANVRSRIEETHQAFPDYGKVDPVELLRNIKHAPVKIPGRNATWRPLDVNQRIGQALFERRTEFLLERVVVHRGKTDMSRLITAARNLLKLSLMVFARKDYFWRDQIDILDVIGYYALPSAGVLAIELLKRDQLEDDDGTFPRSEVLQQLSILVPELEGISPDEGNYSMCQQGLSAIKKVLDTTLTRRAQHLDGAQDMLLDGQLGFNNDADFLNWLSNVDFETASWYEGV